MGSANTKDPSQGVPANPRLVYSSHLDPGHTQPPLIDTPVLVDFQHGSVRYRFDEKCATKNDYTERVEYPHEFQDTAEKHKTDYFYHSRLPASHTTNEPVSRHNLMVVRRGPASCMKKKLFYVYGIGMGSQDGRRIKPSQHVDRGNQDFTWPGIRQSGGIYLNMTLKDSEPPKENHVISDEIDDSSSSNLKLTVSSEESMLDIKTRLVNELKRPGDSIHLVYGGKEIRDTSNDLRIGDVINKELGRENVKVTFTILT